MKKVDVPDLNIQDKQIPLPDNFQLSYEMMQYAKSKFILDVESVFSEFKLYYQTKETLMADWEAAWKKWVLNYNKFKNTTSKINKNLELSDEYKEVANRYITHLDIEIEFKKFKNHYLSTGKAAVNWLVMWEQWCRNAKIFSKKFNQSGSINTQKKSNTLQRIDVDSGTYYEGNGVFYKEFKNLIEYVDEFGIKHYLIELKNPDKIQEVKHQINSQNYTEE